MGACVGMAGKWNGRGGKTNAGKTASISKANLVETEASWRECVLSVEAGSCTAPTDVWLPAEEPAQTCQSWESKKKPKNNKKQKSELLYEIYQFLIFEN